MKLSTETFYGWVIRPFEVEIDPAALRRTTEICRFVFGVLLAHRFLSTVGFSVASDEPQTIFVSGISGTAVGLSIAAGFLTPIALACLVFFFLMSPTLGITLGDQAAIVLSWGLLLLGAGTSWSIDGILFRRAIDARRRLYALAVPLTNRNYAYVRSFQVFMYWGMTYTAMAFHWNDAMWLRLQTLHLFFTMPYLSNLSSIFQGFQQWSPGLFDLFCKTGLALQGTWELLLFPLALSKWGMRFATLQGFLFFAFCLVGFRLGYLPHWELIWWSLIFGYPLIAKRSAPTANTWAALPSTPMWCMRAGTAVIGLFLGFITLFIFGTEPVRRALLVPLFNTYSPHRMFAQYPINVFNRADMEMGSDNFVIVQTAADGTAQRILPFHDKDGARLSAFRNDLLYLKYSIHWQRASRAERFTSSQPVGPSTMTEELIVRLIQLDRCLRRSSAPEQFAVTFYRREIDDSGAFPVWTSTQAVGEKTFLVDGSAMANWYCRNSFRIP